MITQSSIKRYQDCEYKFKLRYVDLYREDKESEPLVLGSLVHLGLEAFLLGKPLEVALEEIERSADTYLLCDKDPSIIDKSCIFVEGYYKRYAELHAERYETVSVEQEFTMELGPNTIGGKFDGVLRDKKTGEIILIEHKTCGDWTAKDAMGVYWQQRQNAFDTQLVIYQEALRRDMGLPWEKPPRIIYDVIYKDKTQMKDLSKMHKFYTDDSMMHRFSYTRQDIVYTPADRLRALSEYKALATRIQDRMEDGEWLRNTNACRKGWGMCEFFKVCQGMDDLETADNLVKLGAAHPELPQLMEEKK